jgi:hypothetical protein
VVAVAGSSEGELLRGGDEALGSLLLGAPEVGAPARTVEGALEGTFRGDGEGTKEEDTSGAIEGPGLGGDTGVAVAIVGLSIGDMGNASCRCNRRCLVRGSEAPSCSFPLESVRGAVLVTDDRRYFCCDLSAWQPTTRQATKITNALDLDNMLILIVSLYTILIRSLI